MNSFKDIREHRELLNEMQRDALQMIEVLNLNVKSLTDFRKNVQTDIFKYALNKKSLNYTELTDLLYEAENHGLLKFGALTGQSEEINQENKKQILEYYKTLEN